MSDLLTVICPGGIAGERFTTTLEYALKGRPARVLTRPEVPVSHARILFAVPLDDAGMNDGLWPLLAYLRRENRIGLRAAALTFRGNDACGEEPLWKTESRDGFWHRCWTPEPAAISSARSSSSRKPITKPPAALPPFPAAASAIFPATSTN